MMQRSWWFGALICAIACAGIIGLIRSCLQEDEIAHLASQIGSDGEIVGRDRFVVRYQGSEPERIIPLVAKLPAVYEIDFSRTRVRDDDLTPLFRTHKLEGIKLAKTNVTGKCFGELKGGRCLALDLSDCRLVSSLRFLEKSEFQELRFLDISRTSVMPSECAYLALLPTLTILRCDDIDLGGNEFEWLSSVNTLEILSCCNTRLARGNGSRIARQSALRQLYANDTGVDDGDLSAIEECTHLEVLAICGTKVSEAGAARAIRSMRKLNELWIDGRIASPALITSIAQSESMQKVVVRGRQLDDGVVEEIRRLRPGLCIEAF